MPLAHYRLLALLLIYLFSGKPSLAQTPFQRIDSLAIHTTTEYETVDSLAIALTRTLRGELEKARVLFTWIAQNVRYDCRKFHERRDLVIAARDEEDFQVKIKLRREEQALKTMRRKRGICGDYSQLYQAMCEVVGLERR